jgi:hypothetical protein
MWSDSDGGMRSVQLLSLGFIVACAAGGDDYDTSVAADVAVVGERQINDAVLTFDSFSDLAAWSGPGTITSAPFKTGGSALAISNAGSGLQASIRTLPAPLSNVSVAVWYFDDLTPGSVFSISDAAGRYIFVFAKAGSATYSLRLGTTEVDTGIVRTRGFHAWELVTTATGAYARIDGRSLLARGTVADLTQITKISLGRGWSNAGTSVFDDVQVTRIDGGTALVADPMTTANTDYAIGDWSKPYTSVARNVAFAGKATLAVTMAPTQIPGKGSFVNRALPAGDRLALGVWIWDDGMPGTAVTIVGSDGQYAIIHTPLAAQGTPNYVFRINGTSYDSGVPRTPNRWHHFELASSTDGTIARIDGIPAATYQLGVPALVAGTNLPAAERGPTNIALVSLGRGWDTVGTSYFAELTYAADVPAPATVQGVYDADFAASLAHWYTGSSPKPTVDAQVTSLQRPVGATSPIVFTNSARTLAFLAQAMLYEYERTHDSAYLAEASRLLDIVATNHDKWRNAWLGCITDSTLALAAWWMWSELPAALQAKLHGVLVTEARFWKQLYEESIAPRPLEQSWVSYPDGNGAYRTSFGYYHIDSSITQRINILSSGDPTNTRAEENAANAQFLALVGNMLAAAPETAQWRAAAASWAGHALTTAADNAGSETLSPNGWLGNHGITPNLTYTVATVHELQQVDLAFRLRGLPPPATSSHLAGRMSSTLWSKNVTECTSSVASAKPHERACYRGGDWGDTDLQLTTIPLGYWAVINDDGAARTELANRVLYFAWAKRGAVWPSLFGYGAGSGLERFVQPAVQWFILQRVGHGGYRAHRFPAL